MTGFVDELWNQGQDMAVLDHLYKPVPTSPFEKMKEFVEGARVGGALSLNDGIVTPAIYNALLEDQRASFNRWAEKNPPKIKDESIASGAKAFMEGSESFYKWLEQFE